MSLFACVVRRTALRPRNSTESPLPPTSESAVVSARGKICGVDGAAPCVVCEWMVDSARRNNIAGEDLLAIRRQSAGPDEVVRWASIFHLRIWALAAKGRSFRSSQAVQRRIQLAPARVTCLVSSKLARIGFDAFCNFDGL